MTEHSAFGSLQIAFDDRVLRPREWTSAQSGWAEQLLDDVPGGPVLELCAGVGQIGLLATSRSRRQLVCVDASSVACDFIAINALAAGMADRVEVRHARLKDAFGAHEVFPLIIADPPWVPRHQTDRFPEDPLVAIDGGLDGLDVARECLDVVHGHLAAGGVALLQLGNTEQARVLENELQWAGNDLIMGEVQQHVRGVLVRIDRPAAR